MPVRTTRQQDGASRATSQGLGPPVAPGALARPERRGPTFASLMAPGGRLLKKDLAGSVEGKAEEAGAFQIHMGQRSPATRASLVEDDLRADVEEHDSEDLLDPLCRALATGFEWKQNAPLVPPESKPEPVTAAARVSMEQVLDQLVRKIAWSGNSRSGAMRIELGAGALAGATLLVQSEGAELRVKLELPPGADAANWRDRLERRLSARGLQLAELEVH